MIVWDEKNNDLIDDFYNLMRRSNEKLNDSGKKEPDYFMGRGGRWKFFAIYPPPDCSLIAPTISAALFTEI